MRILLLVSLFSFQLIASEMVFLVEGPTGRHVGISKDNSTYSTLTSGSDWNLYPDISNDGAYITYVKGSDQKSLEVVVENRQNSIKEKWSVPGFILQPKFSDNSNILFFSKNIGGVNKIVKLDLEQARRTIVPRVYNGYLYYGANGEVLEKLGNGYFPTPFESGEKLVYQRNTNKLREIVLVDLNTYKEVIISEGMSPSLSKDERFIAFTKKTSNNWDIHIYDVIDKKMIKVTSHIDRDFSPAFDHLNNLVYTSDRLENGVFSIFKQSEKSWKNQKEAEVILISKAGTSFYAPRMTGILKYKQSDLPKMPGTPRSSFGSIYHNGKIYVVGGHQGAEHTYPPESFTGRMTAFDTKTNTWENLASRLNPCHGFQVAAYGNYIYAFGGFAYEASTSPAWKSLSVVERYDIKNNKWEQISSMPRNRSSNLAVQVGTKVYLLGGWDSTPKFQDDVDGVFHDEVDVYDILTNTFETLNEKLPSKRRAFSGFSKNGKIYFVGGISEGGSHFSLLDEFVEFDPILKIFTQLAPLPFATFAPAAGNLANSAFVFGGMLKLGKWEYEYVRHIYEYNFDKNSWYHTGRYLKESKGFSQVVNWNSKLGILGGHSYDGNSDKPVSSVETFK